MPALIPEAFRPQSRYPGGPRGLHRAGVAFLLRVKRAGWQAFLGLCAIFLGVAVARAQQPAPEGPGNGTELVLPLSAPVRVLDGDTLEADLDGNGRVDSPREHVRLLFVDTPELSESHKGRDPAHGLPARRFLEQALAGQELRLRIPRAEPVDRYGRTLAVVEARPAGGAWKNVNMALVRAGHSPFDTRFSLPEDYDRWEAAEGEAFQALRNIWGDAPSRKRYLARLRKELKTPAAATNPLNAPGVREAEVLDLKALVGRYVRVRGTVVSRRTLAKGVELLKLKRGSGQPELSAVVFPTRARVLDLTRWNPGLRVELHGFLQRYQGRPEIQVHYGRLLNPAVDKK